MTQREMHIAFCGGNTLGHLFPGLAVADLLRCGRPGLRITFVGNGAETDAAQVAKAGHAYCAMDCAPLPRTAWETIRFLRDNLSGYRAASQFLSRQRVSAVIGLGGFAAAPLAKAAARRGIPLLLMEQNAVPGRVTSWLARHAAAVCTAFEETAAHLPPESAVHLTGNPLRREFNDLPLRSGPTRRRSEGPVPNRLIVLGGSQGAEMLNKQVPRALYKAGRSVREWQIVHQTGPNGWEATRDLYRKLGLKAFVVPFVDKIAHMLCSSDLVVSRAGGTTLAELATAGVPALLVPYPHAANDHQRRNADVFVAAGAAELVDAREVKGRLDNTLAEHLSSLLLDAGRRRGMALAMRGQAHPHAAEHVARLVYELIQSRAALCVG